MPANKHGQRGIVTIAIGSQVYLDMARDLALSMKLHCPGIPRAVLTDATSGEIIRLFDIVIPYRTEYGRGLYPKTCIDQYTPFLETLFIDGDSLVVRDLDFIWKLFGGREFAFVGQAISSGYWYTDIPALLARLRLTSLPSLNSGMFFFKQGDVATRVLRRTREIFLDEGQYPLDPWGNSRTDEIPLAIALEEAGIAPVPDQGTTMRTPIRIQGTMDIDVLAGRCVFEKDGETVNPAIVHFATWQFHPIYYRERAKLRLLDRSPMWRPFASIGAQVIYRRELALRMMREWKQRTGRGGVSAAADN
jgi:hypothetical protein